MVPFILPYLFPLPSPGSRVCEVLTELRGGLMADLLSGETLTDPCCIWIKAQCLVGLQPSLLLHCLLQLQRIHRTGSAWAPCHGQTEWMFSDAPSVCVCVWGGDRAAESPACAPRLRGGARTHSPLCPLTLATMKSTWQGSWSWKKSSDFSKSIDLKFNSRAELALLYCIQDFF